MTEVDLVSYARNSLAIIAIGVALSAMTLWWIQSALEDIASELKRHNDREEPR